MSTALDIDLLKEVEQFVYREARFQDDHEYDAWEALWTDDAIYWVPGHSDTLAHVLARESLVRDRPTFGRDVTETRSYVQALTTPANFRWTSRHSAEIEAALRPEDVVSVQITYHRGWRALANGKSCRVSGDGLGLIVVEPECAGKCKVDLIYDGGPELRAATLISGAGWLGCIIWILSSRRKRL